MDERKQRILHAIIQDYIKSAEPVGSRTLAKNYKHGVSPATVRNEMADLEELGFLEQPHTSAGRIPSPKGYRYYVDDMMHLNGTQREDAERINQIWNNKPSNLEDFFFDVAKLISQISHNMSLVLAPAHNSSTLKFIHVLPIGPNRAVMVVVTDVGALDNESIHFNESVSEEELAGASIKFSNALKDVRIADISPFFLEHTVKLIEGPRELLMTLATSLYRAIAKRKLFYSIGTTELLEQPEFKDVKKVQSILSILEKEDQLTQLIEPASPVGIDIKIGDENKSETMKNLSVIQANFGDSDERIGTLAILGPTRMEYRRIIGILSYIQDFVKLLKEHKK